MPSDVNAVDELDLPDLDSPAEPPGPARPDRARRRGSKGEQTRRAIAEAALRLFREQGYEATTMRAIAREAGVATGNAYYYFGSKEELIHAYYARNHAEHAVACRAVLDTETRLDRRIAGVLRAIEGARIRVPAGLRSRLPELLWLYSMGIVLYWVHDSSPGCEKTYRLIDVTAPLTERLVRLARLPVLRSMPRRLLAVLDEVLG